MLERLLEPGRAVAAAALRIPVVAELVAATTALDKSGGALLAAALAYRAMFGLLAGLAFACGLVGWAFDDPARRDAAVEAIAAAVPGLASVAREGLATLATGRGALSIIGFLGSAWAASLFYDVLDDAIARVMPGGRVRGMLHRRGRGVVAVITLALAALAALTIRLALPSALEWVLGLALLALGLLAIYRFVPVRPPTLRAAALPAVAAALAIRVAAEVFGLVAPILVQNLQIFGVVVSLLALLVWLGWACRLLLLGAAWAALRRDVAAGPVAAPPMLDSPAP
jgi:membrane protein